MSSDVALPEELAAVRTLARRPITMLAEDAVDAALVAGTDKGKVAGYLGEKGVVRFASIPFAAPPIGPLRYCAPRSMKAWSGILDARPMRPSCIQRVDPRNQASINDQSEDCLWLSVTTPAVDNGKRPVIVWIHGGGFYAGVGEAPIHDGASFAARGDVVFVNVQYRRGILGWLDVSHLGGEDEQDSARIGLLDQLAALRWVRRNIAHFGGDPDNVTLMGESAGARSVAYLVQLAEATSLFHKAILQSGIHDPWTTKVPRREVTDFVMRLVGAGSLKALRMKEAAYLRRAEIALHKVAAERGLLDAGTFLGPPSLSREDLRRAAESGKPILHGTNAQDHHYFLLRSDGAGTDNDRTMAQGIFGAAGLSPEQIDELVGVMKKATPEREERDLYVDAVSAAYAHYPHLLMSELYGAGARVYTYLFDWPSPTFPDLGAFRGLELPFVFGTLSIWWLWATGGNPPQRLSHEMQDAWIAFARSGNPCHPGLPVWPACDAKRRPTMRFGATSLLVDDPMPWVRDLGAKLEAMLNRSG